MKRIPINEYLYVNVVRIGGGDNRYVLAWKDDCLCSTDYTKAREKRAEFVRFLQTGSMLWLDEDVITIRADKIDFIVRER